MKPNELPDPGPQFRSTRDAVANAVGLAIAHDTVYKDDLKAMLDAASAALSAEAPEDP